MNRSFSGDSAILFALFLVLCQPLLLNAFQCIGENGNFVDWWIIYKLPRVYGSPDKALKYGSKYLFVDYKNRNWTESPVDIDDTERGALALTLKQIYDSVNQTETFYFMYNDAYPNNTVNWKAAHSKGVTAFNKQMGFWLIHSVPKFPSPTKYAYPKTGKVFGQTLLCVTFDAYSLPEIGEQLFFMNPGIYGAKLPPDLADRVPILNRILLGDKPKEKPYTRATTLRSAGGRVFRHFAKYKKWKRELYHDFVAPDVKANLLVESWQRGQSTNLPSNCSKPFYVENIRKIMFTNNLSFSSDDDHSKWAVSDRGPSITCIGDINRQAGQLGRGGGTMCVKSKGLWKRFRDSVSDLEDCPVTFMQKLGTLIGWN